MRKKIHFWQSVNFKIAVAFILLLLISIEIIGNYFIKELEDSSITSFQEGLNPRVEQLAASIGDELSSPNQNATEVNQYIQKQVNSFITSDTLEIRVVDDRGIIRAANGENQQGSVGKKNDYKDLNDFTVKHYASVSNGERVWINVQPIQNSTGDTIIGAVYVKSDIEREYTEVSDIAFIFFTASMIAAVISVIVAILIARSITKPIEEMREQAVRIARGDYSSKVTVHGRDELSQLAETFNQLSDRIEITQESMEAERNRLNSVLAHMTDGVIATDRRGKVITINDMALNQLNIKIDEVIGYSILKLLDIQEEYTLRKILEENPEIMIDLENTPREITTLRVDFSMIRRESGFISGIVAVLHDVTEQAKTERERQEFVSNVSHELRTPLTSMRSYLEALNDGAWQDSEVAPNFINVSLEETNRMIRMINDLLNLSRMDSGKTELQLEFVNFNDLVNFVLDRFDMIAADAKEEGKRYTIRREFTKRPLWIEIDTDKMIQVIDNIMNNALKYSPDGGVITVRLVETHNHVILSIQDQGLGIPKKDLLKVFERFYRVDKARARAQGGTGLGLAITKEVINAHGGRIWVESQEGTGSTFIISLPYEPYEDEGWDVE
ncbi:MAG: cell wall metabolism sensor histidine kinase WalK [Lactobacillales bacterium]|jgi:two-component system sensor histidine kinase VicK|nr:cell wall metabolism sensor histidine kinase WalK [Lactobacillales bacterium]